MVYEPFVSPENNPMMINYRGDTKSLDFKFGDRTEVKFSCSVVWEGFMYIFGGTSRERQISRVHDCYLNRIGNLGFDLTGGTCTAVRDESIYWCFTNVNSKKTNKQCLAASGPLDIEQSVQSTAHDHRYSRIVYGDGRSCAYLTSYIL